MVNTDAPLFSRSPVFFSFEFGSVCEHACGHLCLCACVTHKLLVHLTLLLSVCCYVCIVMRAYM